MAAILTAILAVISAVHISGRITLVDTPAYVRVCVCFCVCLCVYATVCSCVLRRARECASLRARVRAFVLASVPLPAGSAKRGQAQLPKIIARIQIDKELDHNYRHTVGTPVKPRSGTALPESLGPALPESLGSLSRRASVRYSRRASVRRPRSSTVRPSVPTFLVDRNKCRTRLDNTSVHEFRLIQLRRWNQRRVARLCVEYQRTWPAGHRNYFR